MRHRRRGRKLGRNPKHQRALLRNLAASLILTERKSEDDDNPPHVKGRVITTLQKAKEVRPLVEKCVTIARRCLPAQEQAQQFATANPYATFADRDSAWWSWRQSPQWQQWKEAMAPVVAGRRHVLRLLGNREAIRVLFTEIAPRFADREGGYTRIVRLAEPRLGDAGTRAILEFVGVRDRLVQKSEKPTIDAAGDDEVAADVDPAAAEAAADQAETSRA